MSMGPHQAYGNIPRSIEYAVGWIAKCIDFCRDEGITYIEARHEGVRAEKLLFDHIIRPLTSN